MARKAFITDGRSLAALAIARSLGEKGFEVHCGEEFKHNVAFYSKFIKRRVLYPSPETHPEQFVDQMLDLARTGGYDIIIPVRDEPTLLLSKHMDRFREYTSLYLADHDKVATFRDKGETVKLARKYGIPCPKTYFPEEMSPEEIKRSVRYPVLVRSRVGSGSRGIAYVGSLDAFDEAYREIKSQYGEPMIQEYVDHAGGHYSIASLFNDRSEPVAVHVYLETKQYPINGGPAVTAVSVKKPAWAGDLLRILQNIGWKGPAHMDVLYDLSTSSPALLEVNPRFWMSLNLCIASGVDFPYLLYRLATGETVEPIMAYREGVKYRWILPNEILWLLQTPDKLRGLGDFANFWARDTCDGVLSIKDPMPAIGTLLQSSHFLLDRKKRESIFKRGWRNQGRLDIAHKNQ